MACLTSQQSELSRSDIASTRLLCDPGVSNFWIPEDVFGKKDNQPGWALIVFQLSGTRWIGDVSKYTTSCKICIRIYFLIYTYHDLYTYMYSHIPWLCMCSFFWDFPWHMTVVGSKLWCRLGMAKPVGWHQKNEHLLVEHTNQHLYDIWMIHTYTMHTYMYIHIIFARHGVYMYVYSLLRVYIYPHIYIHIHLDHGFGNAKKQRMS